MDTNASSQESPKFPENSCQNCGHPDYDPEYDFKLCAECRKGFSRLNIPLWLKGVAVGVLIIVVISLFLIRESFVNYYHYKKAEKYFTEKNYASALEYFHRVTPKGHDKNIEVKSKLLICYYYSFNIDSTVSILNQLSQEFFRDASLLSQVENIAEHFSLLVKNADSTTVVKDVPVDSLDLKERLLTAAWKRDTTNIMLMYYLCDNYYDQKKFSEAIKILEPCVRSYPDFQNVTSLLASCYRETKQYDKAIDVTNRLFEINKENLIAYSALAKIELKRKNDAKGLEYAQKAYQLDSLNTSALTSMAIACHFNKQEGLAKSYLDKARLLGMEEDVIRFYNDIISTASNWRQ